MNCCLSTIHRILLIPLSMASLCSRLFRLRIFCGNHFLHSHQFTVDPVASYQFWLRKFGFFSLLSIILTKDKDRISIGVITKFAVIHASVFVFSPYSVHSVFPLYSQAFILTSFWKLWAVAFLLVPLSDLNLVLRCTSCLSINW